MILMSVVEVCAVYDSSGGNFLALGVIWYTVKYYAIGAHLVKDFAESH